MNGNDYSGEDAMHIIPKSHSGLGIEENGVFGCRYHHYLLDNGDRVLRDEMQDIIETYMKSIYTDWSRDKLMYRKW